MSGEGPPVPARSCHACGRPVADAAQAGRECECGAVVCTETACFEEYFEVVAEGEGTRCRTCGQVT